MRSLILAVLVLVCGVLPLGAQETSALINEALDQRVELELNSTLPEAMRAITEKTGVPIEADRDVWQLLPWGEQTTVTASIKDATLRGALQAITQELGLRFVLADEAVELRPVPALKRLARRATVEELNALSLLTSTPFNQRQSSMRIGRLLEAVDQQLLELKSPYAIENRVLAIDELEVPVPRNATLADALDVIPTHTNATWYPWGQSVLVVQKTDPIRNQLQKTVTRRWEGVDVNQVLLELSQLSGVPFHIEPGAVGKIPPELRNIRLVLDNASIQQALENIAGFTGLGYVVNDEGVYLWNQQSQSAAGRDPIVGVVPLDNGMQAVITQSQVTPELRQYLEHKTREQLEKVREMMKDEGFRPATQPAAGNEDL